MASLETEPESGGEPIPYDLLQLQGRNMETVQSSLGLYEEDARSKHLKEHGFIVTVQGFLFNRWQTTNSKEILKDLISANVLHITISYSRVFLKM